MMRKIIAIENDTKTRKMEAYHNFNTLIVSKRTKMLRSC